MRYLLDVNVLVAWGWSDHVAHARAARWIASQRGDGSLLTSAIPQLGFVRVSVQRTGGAVGVTDAADVLRGMLQSLGDDHEFVADDRASTTGWPGWCQAASRSTDGHLLALAGNHQARLATLDESIPGAFVIPEGL